MFNYESSIGETDKFRKPHNYQIIFPNFFLTKPKNILEIGTSSCGFAKFLKDNKIGEWIVGADITKGLVSHHIPSNLTWEHLFDDFFEGDAMSQEFRDWIAKKEYKFEYRHQLINNSYNNNSIFYSLGSKYGRISGSFDKKNVINNYSLNTVGSTSQLNEKQSLKTWPL